MNYKETQTQKQTEIDNNIKQLSAVAYARYLVEKKHSEAVDMVETCPQNVYIEEWKSEANQTARHLEALEQVADKLAKEQSALYNDLERAEQGKPQLLTLKLDPISAKIVADMLEYYNLYNLEEAEKRDPFKDNSPYIKAIKSVLEAYKEATKESEAL